jgi:hypothetical protein
VPISLTLDLPQLQNVNTSNLQGFPSSRTAKDHIQSARAKKITPSTTWSLRPIKADSFSIATAVTGTPQRTPVTIQADLDLGVEASLF